ncbi:hypothetical protein SAMN05421848_2448 [Kushneria avicenniae]|uniref:EAL domain, c-di-GMP-specific phosphodiesterase class I (Or its enzymatically inactive variant) n=1 Tax=Kushneria avicenniae TaxID=402385 RepID=A0A1I1LI43_9GAMM|nr:hypothetical protein [Kushneria avicenniae]SFC72192.1 hypothetical protein SAMN05421848_2448 [Kushneria avicenniae]
MPLTSVVAYFNQHLASFNPASSLHCQAEIHYASHHLEGGISARLGDLTLIPDMRAIRTPGGDIMGWEGELMVQDGHQRSLRREALYLYAWDSEDIVFVDRFLRVLHALHYLHCLSMAPLNALRGHDQWQLMLDVHWRHMRAVHDAHGEVFEGLLQRLGLSTRQIVLRLQAPMLIEDSHAHAAVRSFIQRGYTLLVDHLSVDDPAWSLMQSLGVCWVSPDTGRWQSHHTGQWVRHDQWVREAHRHGLKVLLRRPPKGREALMTHADAVLDASLTVTALPAQARTG